MTQTPRHAQRTAPLPAGRGRAGGRRGAVGGTRRQRRRPTSPRRTTPRRGSGPRSWPSAGRTPTRGRAAPAAASTPASTTGTATSTTTRRPRTPSAAAARRPHAPDRTTPAQRAASRARVAAQRTQREPRLVGVPLRSKRRRVPESVYAMAGGCYRLGGQPLTFQATGLGSYLLYAPDRTFLAAAASGGAAWAAAPVAGVGLDGPQGRHGPLHLHPRRRPRAAAYVGGGFATGAAESFALRRTDGCTAVPRGRDQRQRPPVRRGHAASRRSAATSTRTSTARPTSSSAAG